MEAAQARVGRKKIEVDDEEIRDRLVGRFINEAMYCLQACCVEDRAAVGRSCAAQPPRHPRAVTLRVQTEWWFCARCLGWHYRGPCGWRHRSRLRHWFPAVHRWAIPVRGLVLKSFDRNVAFGWCCPCCGPSARPVVMMAVGRVEDVLWHWLCLLFSFCEGTWI